MEDVYNYSLSSYIIFKFHDCFIGHTIPGVILSFFKVAGEYVVLGSVFVFALAWLLKAKPHNRPKQYSIIVFDIFGKQTSIEGIRTEFKTHDVTWSFMKQYKKTYPLYNFAMVSNVSKSDKPTIFKYI